MITHHSAASASTAVPSESLSDQGRCLGNAATTGTYSTLSDDVSHGQGLSASGPVHASHRSGEPDTEWQPRAPTIKELRARFREGQYGAAHAARGRSVDRVGPPPTDFDLVEQEGRQRVPEPMPASWRAPVQPAPRAATRQLLGGLGGLILGLALSLPLVFWHKGHIDPVALLAPYLSSFGLAAAAPVTAHVPAPPDQGPQAKPWAPASPPVSHEAPMPLDMVRSALGGIERSASNDIPVLEPARIDDMRTAPALTSTAAYERLLEDARRLMAEGDFTGARSLLEEGPITRLPVARFLLAETYDPNYLAARGIRSVRAEVPRAIALYREALHGGIEPARQRIIALRP